MGKKFIFDQTNSSWSIRTFDGTFRDYVYELRAEKSENTENTEKVPEPAWEKIKNPDKTKYPGYMWYKHKKLNILALRRVIPGLNALVTFDGKYVFIDGEIARYD